MGGASAQTPTVTPNYKDADIRQIIEAVSEVTGQNFIIDPRVKAEVTMLSSSPMSPEAFYEAFLSILEVHGYVAVPSGDLIKIVPDANARQVPGRDLPSGPMGQSDEIVTQVIQVRECRRGPAGADPATADPPIRASRRPPGLQHADHLRPLGQREPDDADHRAHRPGR